MALYNNSEDCSCVCKYISVIRHFSESIGTRTCNLRRYWTHSSSETREGVTASRQDSRGHTWPHCPAVHTALKEEAQSNARLFCLHKPHCIFLMNDYSQTKTTRETSHLKVSYKLRTPKSWMWEFQVSLGGGGVLVTYTQQLNKSESYNFGKLFFFPSQVSFSSSQYAPLIYCPLGYNIC